MRNHVFKGNETNLNNITLISLFEEQAQKNKKKVALQFQEKKYSYEELNSRSNQFAYCLKEIGVNKETLIGVYLERSENIIITLLGILKVGATYVPLDPIHPIERNTYIIKQAQIKYVITQKNLVEEIADQLIEKICIDEIGESICRQPQTNLEEILDLNQLAYVIFTSGSTGKPKGVAIKHQGVANYLSSMREGLDLTGDEVAIATITITFDFSVTELFLPLVSGAKLIITETEVAKDGTRLKQLIEQEEVTLLQTTPSTLYMLLDAGWMGNEELVMLVGGEAWTIQLAKELLNRPHKSLWNAYGPTETTVFSSLARINREDEVIALGKPINNTILYLLDEEMNPVDVGEEGELYIGGVGVAKGYLNNELLTKENFVRNPFIEENNLIYKTGDIIKQVDKGTLIYTGRKDFQVKVRGFRIELGEIEKAILSDPKVSQAIVVAVIKQEQTNLCAYVKCKEDSMTNQLEIKYALEQLLPSYMIPNFIILVQDFPKTANGKIDRKALMAQQIEKNNSNEYLAPRTEIEEEIVGLWEELLELKPIGIREEFLELGGHSLMANRLVIRMNKLFGTNLTLLDILATKLTVEDMARVVEENLLNNLSEEELAMLLDEIEEEE